MGKIPTDENGRPIEEPDFTDEDGAIMDRVWAEIAAEKAAIKAAEAARKKRFDIK